MRFQLVAAFAAMASAVALPTTNDTENPTIGHAQNVCGSLNKQLNCCSQEQEIVGLGLLSNLLGGLGLFNGCSSLSVTALIGIDNLLNDKCRQTAACCDSGTVSQNGLINVALPCIALNDVL